MHLRKNHIFTAAILAVTFAFGASHANAQLGRGSFDLPFQVRWGATVLQPGHYTLTLPVTSSAVQPIYLFGNGKTVVVMSAITGVDRKYGPSYLRLVNLGDTYAVKELEFGATGTSYNFPVPRSRAESLASRSTHQSTIAIQ